LKEIQGDGPFGNTGGPSETTEKVGVQDANLQTSMRFLGLCPKNEVYSEIFGIMGGNISLHYPFFIPLLPPFASDLPLSR